MWLPLFKIRLHLPRGRLIKPRGFLGAHIWAIWDSDLLNSRKQLFYLFWILYWHSCYSYFHVTKTLAGIYFFLKLQGFHSCTELFSVRQALKGYHKRNMVADSRLPITADVLSRLCESTTSVCVSSYESLLFRVAFSLSFFGAFRISELLPLKTGDYSGIFISDVKLSSGFLQIFLRIKPISWIEGVGLLRQLGNSPVCPVFLVQQFLQLRRLVSPTCCFMQLVYLSPVFNSNPYWRNVCIFSICITYVLHPIHSVLGLLQKLVYVHMLDLIFVLNFTDSLCHVWIIGHSYIKFGSSTCFRESLRF